MLSRRVRSGWLQRTTLPRHQGLTDQQCLLEVMPLRVDGTAEVKSGFRGG